MKSSLKIFTVFGIPIELHISFLLLMVFIYVVAFIGAISLYLAFLITLLFITVVIHELSHSYVAQKYGVNIEKIVLFPIGGVSAMEEIPKDPTQELKIAVAGPLTNIIIAAICLVLIIILGYTEFLTLSSIFILNTGESSLALFLTNFLGVNLVLGIFNLLPAFPMDGGRVLRAYLARKRDYVDATKTAARVGKQFAILMAIAGVFLFNFILILIAIFIYLGADQEYQAILVSNMLEGVQVKDIMTRDVKTLNPDNTVSEALYTMFQQKHMGYPVKENDKLAGIITFDDISRIPEDKRDTLIGDIMTKDLILANPNEGVATVFEKINRKAVGRLPVVQNGELVGIVSKTDVVKTLEMLEAKYKSRK